RLRFDADEGPNANDWQDAVRAKVDEAVRVHMIADVPVGAFLSGGVDSAFVVACGTDSAKVPLQTFSLGFRDERISELPAARAAAIHFGTRHADDVVTPDAVALLGELTHHFDE